MNHSSEQRPYNSAVIDNYINYLEANHPDIRIGPILNEANIKPWETSDPGHWFTQQQVNDFHKALKRRISNTAETTLARSVGRFTASEKSNRFMRLAAIHLLRPENIFPISKKVTAKFIKSVDVDWRKIHDSKYELILTFRKSIKPKRFQCENYIGNVEAIIRLFTDKWPDVEHPECFFQGDDCCRYVISWKKERFYYINKLRSISLFSFLIISVLIVFNGSFLMAGITIAIGMALFHHLTVYSELIQKRNSIESLKRNDFKILDLYDVMANFHDYTNVFGEAAKSISSHTTVDKVLEKFSQSLVGLGYSRGLICLLDDKTNNMRLQSIFGYDNSKKAVINRLKAFALPLEAKKISAIQMFESIEELGGLLPDAITLNFQEIRSPLLIPMIYEKRLIGIIVAQNERGHDSLSGSDIFLAQAVASQTALVITNIAAYETVTANEKLKNQFLTIAGHELRTPIQAIFLAYDDLNDKLSAEQKANVDSSLTAIEKSVIRLETIIDNIMNLSKIEARDSLNEARVPLDNLLYQAVHGMEHITNAANHTLIVSNHVSPDACLYCDEGLVVQVMTNLINNASKFTPAGGKILVKAYQTDAELRVEFIDNGFGVPKEAHQKIFMKFFQVKSEGSSIENDGCGLGLSICKEVVQKHGGYITVESPIDNNEYPDMQLGSPRKGTLIRIHLPIERLR